MYWSKTSSISKLHDNTRAHHNQYDFCGWVIRPARRPLTDNIQQSQDTDIHAPGGIRTRNPIKRAAADPRHLDPLKEGIPARNGFLLFVLFMFATVCLLLLQMLCLFRQQIITSAQIMYKDMVRWIQSKNTIIKYGKMMVFISKEKLHVSAYRGHLQVLIIFC